MKILELAVEFAKVNSDSNLEGGVTLSASPNPSGPGRGF
jgi:hypothetical protein